MQYSMETESDSISIASIRHAALGTFEASKAANLEQGVSSEDRLKEIQKAFQRSIATTTISQNNGNSTLAATVQLAEHAVDQNTFPDLASTVPDSQALLDIGNFPTAIPHVFQPPVTDPRKMSTQGSLPQDTQPVSQSIYESIITKAKSVRKPDEDVEDDVGTGIPQDSLQEGDEGHIDLLSSYKDQQQEMHQYSDSEPVEFSPTQTPHHLSQFPESQRFKTPGTTSRKRNYNGDIIETPSLPRNPLVRNGGPTPGKMMGLSQAFAATQAVSSPFVDGLQSGSLSDRPSPNIELDPRPATASLSSPIRPRSDLRRTATEPYSHYKSIKQSQAERERLARLGQLGEGDQVSSISDEGSDDEPSLIERRRRQREREAKVREQFQAVSSPPRPRSRETVGPFSSPARKTTLLSPRTSPRTGKAVRVQVDLTNTNGHNFFVDDDEDLLHESEEETEQEDDIHIAVKMSSQIMEYGEEDKENAGLEVPETVAPFRQTIAVASGQQVEDSPSVRHSAGKTQPRVESPELNVTELFAVADSQASQSARTAPRGARKLLTSSGEGQSFVPQSQMLLNGTHGASSSVHDGIILPSEAEQEPRVAAGGDGDQVLIQHASSGKADAVEQQPAEQHSPRQVFDETAMLETMGLVVQARRFASRKIPPSDSTIAETSSLTRKESDIVSSATQPARPKPATFLGEDASRGSTEFETAQTRLSDNSEVVLPPLPPQTPSIFASPSGRKRRRLGDIANDPSPGKLGSQIDMDAAMAIVEDKEFDNVIGSSDPISPGRRIKRRRLNQRQTVSSFPDHIPAVAEEQEFARRAPQHDDSVVPQSDEVTDQDDGHGIRSSSHELEYVRPMLRTRGIRSSLATPVQKLAPVRTSTRNSRANEGLWDIQASPEKTVPAKPRAQLAKEQKPPSTMPTGRVQPTASTATPTSAMQSKRSSRRSSHGSMPEHDECLAPIAVSTSAKPRVTHDPPFGDIVAPNQVLACFNGKTKAYYPATCVGITGSDSLRYLCRWEGYEPDEIDAHGVRRLDLRIGDAVKIDYGGFPKVSHVICGFKNKTTASEQSGPMTEIRGYKTLQVVPKQRKSLPADLITQTVKEVPVGAIYLDSNMWNQMKGRDFEYTTLDQSCITEFATPSERPSTPTTPSSRSRRNAALHANLSIIRPGGIFANMAFAISYDAAERKSSLTHLITTNGGAILLDGFNELFEDDNMTLKPKFANLGFTALLADRHSRKAKYLQALALNLPCLSGKWIETCIAKESVVSWQPYLLPAGDSAFLGTIRSRVIQDMVEPTNAKVVFMVTSRPNLLDQDAVVLVTGRGKAEEKRKDLVFLARAAGAGRLEKVTDFKTAITHATENSDVRWILVEDRDVDTASSMLEQTTDQEEDEPRPLKVVGNEFICQSLILGALVEE